MWQSRSTFPLRSPALAVRPEEQHRLATGLLAVSEQELRGVNAIQRTVDRHPVRDACEGGEGLVPVVRGEHLVGHDADRDIAGRAAAPG
jgi:hypothetical protein